MTKARKSKNESDRAGGRRIQDARQDARARDAAQPEVPAPFTVSTEVPAKKIAGLLCTGFEGGVGYWCRIMTTIKPKDPSAIRPVLDEGGREPKVWEFYDYPLLGGATVCRLDDGDTKDTDKRYTPLVLDGAAIARGLKLMAEKWPRHYANFISENDDATTGDVFIQLCLLGDIVYD